MWIPEPGFEPVRLETVGFGGPRPSDPRAAVDLVLDRMQPGELVAFSNFLLAFVRYLGDRPDIDPARSPVVDHRLHPRKKVSEIIDELRSAPVVYVFGWENVGLRPELAALAAERDVSIERFGLATIWILS